MPYDAARVPTQPPTPGSAAVPAWHPAPRPLRQRWPDATLFVAPRAAPASAPPASDPDHPVDVHQRQRRPVVWRRLHFPIQVGGREEPEDCVRANPKRSPCVAPALARAVQHQQPQSQGYHKEWGPSARRLLYDMGTHTQSAQPQAIRRQTESGSCSDHSTGAAGPHGKSGIQLRGGGGGGAK